MITAAATPEDVPVEGELSLIGRVAELCNPFLDGLNEVTLLVRGPVASSVLRWNSTVFHPLIQPLIHEVLNQAAEGASFEIMAADCRLDSALPKSHALQSRDAGKRLVSGLLAPKGDRLIERYRAAVLAGDSPGHLAVMHSLRAAVFHQPPRLTLASYLLQEGIGAGLSSPEVSRFLIGPLTVFGQDGPDETAVGVVKR